MSPRREPRDDAPLAAAVRRGVFADDPARAHERAGDGAGAPQASPRALAHLGATRVPPSLPMAAEPLVRATVAALACMAVLTGPRAVLDALVAMLLAALALGLPALLRLADAALRRDDGPASSPRARAWEGRPDAQADWPTSARRASRGPSRPR